MIEFGQRRPDDQIPALAKPQAEIDIVEGDPQLAVEPADLVEHRSPHCETSCRHSREVLLQQRAAEVPGIMPLTSEVEVPGNTAGTQNHAGVLHPPAGIDQLGPDRAHLDAAGIGNQV